MSIIYVVHPVSVEQKQALKKKGKILDASFAPEDSKIYDADGKEIKPAKETKPAE